MPLERTIVQVLLLFSVPLRLIVLLKHCKAFLEMVAQSALENLPIAGLEYSVIDQSRWFVLVRRLMVLCGAADVLFLSLLSTIGERENGGKPNCPFLSNAGIKAINDRQFYRCLLANF